MPTGWPNGERQSIYCQPLSSNEEGPKVFETDMYYVLGKAPLRRVLLLQTVVDKLAAFPALPICINDRDRNRLDPSIEPNFSKVRRMTCNTFAIALFCIYLLKHVDSFSAAVPAGRTTFLWVEQLSGETSPGNEGLGWQGTLLCGWKLEGEQYYS